MLQGKSRKKISQKNVESVLRNLNSLAEQKLRKHVENGGDNSKDRFFKYKSKKTKIIGFDTEDNSKGHCHLLTFYDGKRYYDFFNNDQALFWLHFADFKSDVILWALNTDYDLNNLCYSDTYLYMFERIYNKSRFIMAKLALKNSIKIYDIINYYSMSALDVGEMFGLKKLNFDFNKDRKHRKDGTVIVSKKEIKYCHVDSEIVYTAGKFIYNKLATFEIKVTPTVASCALQTYLKHYSPSDFTLFNPNRYRIKNEDVYASYYGGRTEAFYYGWSKGSIHYYDINSLYPSVMLNQLYPDVYSRVRKSNDLEIESGFICCKVKVPDMFCPPLPVRNNGKLIFPTGTFVGVWTVPELQNAMKYGVKVLYVYWSYEFEKMIDLFSGYIGDMYKKRLESRTKPDNEFYKVFMNSLYGKFAEKRRVTKYVSLEDSESLFDPIIFDRAQITEEFLPVHNNTIISSYVTAYGRNELYKYLNVVLDKGRKLLYCDTDSVIFQGHDLFTESNLLGGIKREHNIKKIQILGAKYYQYKDVDNNEYYVCKGVPRNNQRDMFLKGESSYKKPIRYRESVRRKIKANIWVDITKVSKNVFDKRIILSDGNSTKPIKIKA